MLHHRDARPLEVAELDADTFVVSAEARRGRSVVQVGASRLRTHLVVSQDAARRSAGRVQRGLGDFTASVKLAQTLRALDINVVIDVGANRGQFAQRLREAGYRGRIASFEPLSGFVAELEEAAASDDAWEVFPYALGEEDGQTEINVDSGPLSSLLPSSEFGREWNDRLRETRRETIQVRRLDGLFDLALGDVVEPRVFLKLDTQGFDLHAFRGAGGRIKEVLGLLSEVCCVPIYEGMPRLTEQIAEYEAAGFEIAGMFPVTVHHATLRVIEFDALMVRAQAVVKR